MAGATTVFFDRKYAQMYANVAFGNGWRMKMLMNGRMGSLPHGPHWKFPPDGQAAGWVDFLPPIIGARNLQVRERSPIANSTARGVRRMDRRPHGKLLISLF